MVAKQGRRKTFDRRLVAYSAAAGAAMALAPTADATIIRYDGPWTATGQNTTLISFNLAGDVVTNGLPSDAQFAFFNTSGFPTYGTGWNKVRITGYNDAMVLKANTHVARLPSSTWVGNGNWAHAGLIGGTSFGYWVGNWSPGQRGYVGLMFDGPDTTVYYGWADITLNSEQSITLHAYAYDDSGAPIHTPQPGPSVPEPCTLGLLALGAAGLAAIRRRRSA